MKIIFNTQFNENYGSHDWDGKGECPQYWKAKGGFTYVLEDVTSEQAVDKEFWVKLENTIEYSDVYTSEWILDYQLVDNDVPTSEFHNHWECPILITVDGSQATFHHKIDIDREFQGINLSHSMREVVKTLGSHEDVDAKFYYVDTDGKKYSHEFIPLEE